MKETTRRRACAALFNAKTHGDFYFPKIFVCGEHPWFFFNVARRCKRELDFLEPGKEHDIEVITIEEAHRFLYGKPLPRTKRYIKCFDSTGEEDQWNKK